MHGELIWHPNVVAPDGSLGVYRYDFRPRDDFAFDAVSLSFELLAAGMPFLENNLAYYPVYERRGRVHRPSQARGRRNRQRQDEDTQGQDDAGHIREPGSGPNLPRLGACAERGRQRRPRLRDHHPASSPPTTATVNQIAADSPGLSVAVTQGGGVSGTTEAHSRTARSRSSDRCRSPAHR